MLNLIYGLLQYWNDILTVFNALLSFAAFIRKVYLLIFFTKFMKDFQGL